MQWIAGVRRSHPRPPRCAEPKTAAGADRRPEATALDRTGAQHLEIELRLVPEGDWDGRAEAASVQREFCGSDNCGIRCQSWALSGLPRTPMGPARVASTRSPYFDRLRWQCAASTVGEQLPIVWTEGGGLVTGLAPEITIAFADSATLLAGEEAAFELDVPRLAQKPRQIDSQALDHRAEPQPPRPQRESLSISANVYVIPCEASHHPDEEGADQQPPGDERYGFDIETRHGPRPLCCSLWRSLRPVYKPRCLHDPWPRRGGRPLLPLFGATPGSTRLGVEYSGPWGCPFAGPVRWKGQPKPRRGGVAPRIGF
jgi:hypothetical protein